MTKSVDNVAVALLLERARRIQKNNNNSNNKKWHNKTLGRLLPT